MYFSPASFYGWCSFLNKFYELWFFGCPGYCSSICFLIWRQTVDGCPERSCSVLWIVPTASWLVWLRLQWTVILLWIYVFTPGDHWSRITNRCCLVHLISETVISNVLQHYRCWKRKWKPICYMRWKARLCISAILYRAANTTKIEFDAFLYSDR
jgi:hypothetical protein